MELLISHPLDCPMCDKAVNARCKTRQCLTAARILLHQAKRTLAKPINISAQVLLDRERSCAPAARFSTRSPAIRSSICRSAAPCSRSAHPTPMNRSESYYSGNTVQICPVGAPNGDRTVPRASVRFGLQPQRLRALRVGLRAAHRPSPRQVLRLASDDPEVSEEWNATKGGGRFTYATQRMITLP